MSDEYIRKKDVSDWLKQYGQDVLHGKYKFSLMYIWKNLMDLPSADVVRVVRCKDCKFYTSMRPDIKTGICDLNVHHMGDDGFCSCGERREG